MVSTLDSESSDPSSNLGGTYSFLFLTCKQPLEKKFVQLEVRVRMKP